MAPRKSRTVEETESSASSPRRKPPCGMCDEYSAHMRHEGLVYQFFNDADRFYHRHIVCCSDLGLRMQTERVQ